MTTNVPITIIHPAPSPHVVDLFEALARHPNVDLRVVYLLPKLTERPGWPASTPRGPHLFLPCHRLGRGEFAAWNPGIIRLIDEGIREGRVHVLGGGYTFPSIAAAMLRLNQLRAPWYFFSEKPGYSASRFKSLPRRAVINATLRGCGGILAASPLAVEAYRSLGFDPARLHVLPYVMRVDEFKSIRREPFHGVTDRPLRLLFMGRLLAVKGIDWAVKALADMKTFADWTLTIAGAGELQAGLGEFIRRHRLAQITMIGEIPWQERAEIFASHDVLLFPSRHDGFGMAVMEALASGMPVLGSSAAGAVAAFVNERNGRIFSPEDAAGLRAALEWFIFNRGKLGEMSRSARASIATWTPDAVASHLMEIVSAKVRQAQ